MNRSAFILFVTLLWFSTTDAVAQDAAKSGKIGNASELAQPVETAPSIDRNAESLRIDELLNELRSPEFAARQKATAELLRLTPVGVGILDQKSRTLTGPEAAQVREIVDRLRKRLFDDRLSQFARSPTIEAAAVLPEWNRYSSVVGRDTKSLELFRQMLEAERELFAMRMFASPELSATLELRSVEFSKLCTGRGGVNNFPTASCAALMWLGSNSEIELKRITSTNISDAFDNQRYSELIAEGTYSVYLRRIAGAWMNRSWKNGRSAIAVDRPLLFAMKHQIPEGRLLALRTIESGAKFQSMYYSILCVASFGNEDDLKVIEPLLDAPTVLWPVRNESAQKHSPDFASTYTIQSRDVALAAAVHLRKRSPEEFGSSAQPSSETVFDVYSLGFDTDESRKTAIDSYRKAFPK